MQMTKWKQNLNLVHVTNRLEVAKLPPIAPSTHSWIILLTAPSPKEKE